MEKTFNQKKKLVFPQEITYVLSLIILSFAVSMTVVADFGVSMIVAPAYILSLKIDFLSFGLAEYVVQAVLIILLCILVRKLKFVFLFSFLTCIVYGLVLDLWGNIIPLFNPAVINPASLEMWQRILLFIGGVLLTGFSVALSFKTYLYPQVYDFFVQKLTTSFNVKLSIIKTIFDFSMLALAVILTLVFFGGFRGIGIGTVIMTCINGFIIGFFSKLLDRLFDFKPLWKKGSALFND